MTTSTHSSTDAPPVRTVVPKAGFFIAGVYALSVMFSLAFMAITITFDLDPAGGLGIPREFLDILVYGTGALVLGVIPGMFLAKSGTGSRVGAIIYGSLAIVTLPFFWSGAPGVFGAVAAWLGGLTRGRPGQHGAGRAFGIVGLCVAVLNCVTTVAGMIIFAIGHH